MFRINRTLSSAGVDANVVIILGVNSPSGGILKMFLKMVQLDQLLFLEVRILMFSLAPCGRLLTNITKVWTLRQDFGTLGQDF